MDGYHAQEWQRSSQGRVRVRLDELDELDLGFNVGVRVWVGLVLRLGIGLELGLG